MYKQYAKVVYKEICILKISETKCSGAKKCEKRKGTCCSIFIISSSSEVLPEVSEVTGSEFQLLRLHMEILDGASAGGAVEVQATSLTGVGTFSFGFVGFGDIIVVGFGFPNAGGCGGGPVGGREVEGLITGEAAAKLVAA